MSESRYDPKSDLAAALVLIGLWLLFFWRLFTPIEADQASLEKGDFSGQFVAFAGYQYQRLTAAEIPLWNPYNNGGLPFIADTQAAVFYPPRLATIALSHLAGGWSYHALELEMTAHVLACTLLMFLLVRRMTLGARGSTAGALVAAITAGYGGFLTSYPPLQLALLEAAIWLPLATLGVLESTRGEQFRPLWLTVTGLAYGLAWMAGHPQTTWLLTYLLLGYLAYRVCRQRYHWSAFLSGAALFGTLGGGLAAVQLLPGVEYLAYTARTNLGFDAKGNGFPFQDVIQFIFPGIVSQWSPLYIGLVGLILALMAVWRRVSESAFWGLGALIALALSLGANSPVYALLYNVLPGLRFFRGQERAAYVVAFSLAILAGLGAAHLVMWDNTRDFKARQRIQQALIGLTGICSLVAGAVFVMWLGNTAAYGNALSRVAFSALMAGAALLLIPWILTDPQRRVWWLAGLLVFDLFTVNMDTPYNFDPAPPSQQLSMAPPPLVSQVLEDDDLPFRVDGYRGLHDNFGSLYRVMDMRGISPLFLDGPYRLIEPDLINPLAWELFAVRYVFTDWQELPVSSQIVGTGEDRFGAINLHRLLDPRPFVQLIYAVRVVPERDSAFDGLADPGFDPRHTIILERDPGITLEVERPSEASARVQTFAPEQFSVAVNTPANAVLSLSHPYYLGWTATLDGKPVEILRAYGALAAVVVPPGEHVVHMVYDPISYRLGSVISIATWGGLGILAIMIWIRKRRKVEMVR